ncbi:hypothetical protein ABZT27_28685 [Streptomyces sp. NPDC005389]
MSTAACDLGPDTGISSRLRCRGLREVLADVARPLGVLPRIA